MKLDPRSAISLVVCERMPEVVQALVWMREHEPLPVALLGLQRAFTHALGREMAEDFVDGIVEHEKTEPAAEESA